MLLISIGYSELNKADPDCGTTFTWATRAFGPKTGWPGGWGIVAADVLVMASLAQVAGQYLFLLVGANGIGSDPTSPWVLLVGRDLDRRDDLHLLPRHRGLGPAAAVPADHRGRHAARLVRGGPGAGGHRSSPSHLAPSSSILVQPVRHHASSVHHRPDPDDLHLLGLGHRRLRQRGDQRSGPKTPGQAAIISTVLLLVTYALVTIAVQSLCRASAPGHRAPANVNNTGDVLSVFGTALFGGSGLGGLLALLLLLMVLTSAAASTQTTILPTARTTLSMAVYHAMPRVRQDPPAVPDADRLHARHGGVSIAPVPVVHLPLRRHSDRRRGDCHRHLHRVLLRADRFHLHLVLPQDADPQRPGSVDERDLPAPGGLFLWFAMGWSLWVDWNYNNTTANSFTSWHLPFPPHSQVGGVFVIVFLSALFGLLLYIYCRFDPARPSSRSRPSPAPRPPWSPRPPKASPVPTNQPARRTRPSARVSGSVLSAMHGRRVRADGPRARPPSGPGFQAR